MGEAGGVVEGCIKVSSGSMKRVKRVKRVVEAVFRVLLNSMYGTIRTWHVWWYVYLPTEALNFLFGIFSWYYFTVYVSGGAGGAFSFLAVGLLVNPVFQLAVEGPHRYTRGLYSGWASSYGYRLSLKDYYKLSGLSETEYIISQFIEDTLFITIRFVAYVTVLSLCFEIPLVWDNLAKTVFVLALGFLSMLPIGFLVASTYVLYYNLPQVVVNPFAWIVSLVSSIVCGVYFPTTVLPGPVQTISRIIPQTYAMHAVRKLMLYGLGLSQTIWELQRLVAFSLLLLPALAIYRRGMQTIDKKL